MAKLKRFPQAHPLLALVVIVAVLVTGSAAYAAFSLMRQESATGGVYFAVPEAPHLAPNGPNQVVYRIDANRSSVSYEVKESLAGQQHTANGSTKGVAGDILLDNANPAASQVGEMVVNVQQLTSDQTVRDNRLRHDFLQSDTYPLARFRTTSIQGLPAQIADNSDVQVRLDGDLTVKTTTLPVTITGTARRHGDEVTVKASTTVSLSKFGVGPISLIGLVSAEDDAVLTLDLTAVDATKMTTQPTLAYQAVAATGTTSGGDAGPSFSGVVQPILERNCASCHNAGTAGASVWRLDTARDAKESASGIGLTTGARYMPPWPASDASVPFDHSLKMSDKDVADLAAWVKAGGQIDVDPSTPIRDTNPNVPHPRTDLELKAEAPYQGSTELANDYRCFVMDPKLTDPKVISAYEFVPDQKEYVHHALVYRMKAASREATDQRDQNDAGTGYRCFGGVGDSVASLVGGGRNGPELVAGWAPGQLPGVYPSGTGLHLDPGDYFVVQVHYHFVHNAPPDQSSLRLEVAPGAPSDYDNIRVTTYLAPAEIPCGPNEAGPLCDRNAVLQQLAQSYGPTAPLIANGLHTLCRTSVDQLAVLDGTVAHSSCEQRVRNGGEILSVLGHMHQIGKTYRMTLNPGTPDERVLLDIPNWDFGWQLNYKPTEKIVLKRGDTIKVECSWDREKLDPAAPPRYVTWNEGTEDEMCFSTIATRDTKP